MDPDGNWPKSPAHCEMKMKRKKREQLVKLRKEEREGQKEEGNGQEQERGMNLQMLRLLGENGIREKRKEKLRFRM